MNMTKPIQFISPLSSSPPEGERGNVSLREFHDQYLHGTLRRDVDMRRHTSWRAGGRVERMYQPADLDDLAAFLRALPADEPLLAVGLGSNLLVRDGGLRGTVLLLHGALGELRIEADGLLYAQAGVPGAKLARFAALHDLSGAEFFAGIPGTVGGMLAMNAGCYSSETWDVTTRAQVITRKGEVLERTAQDYDIAYRHVALRAKQKEWFVGAWFKFSAGDGDASREKIKALLSKRITSQPLNLPNAGSVFRNPPGDYAARLIESCGLKGRQLGGAQVSLKHANFIVNVGDATAADIENLINEVQMTVEKKTGISLHPEVRIVGEAA
jgi:UDP-N-acetylmuramate dehydrogenase